MKDMTPSQERRELQRQWVETCRRAGSELEQIRRREIESADTQEAIRHIFGEAGIVPASPARTAPI